MTSENKPSLLYRLEEYFYQHKITSLLLSVLFLFGVISQTTEIISSACNKLGIELCSSGKIYRSIILNLDENENQTAIEDEGFSMEKTVILSKMTVTPPELVERFKTSESSEILYLHVSGTFFVEDHLDIMEIEGDESGTSKGFVLDIELSDPGNTLAVGTNDSSRVRLHLPEIERSSTWGAFLSEPVTCCDMYFEYRSFVRIERFVQLGMRGAYLEFVVKTADVNADVASKTLQRLEVSTERNS